MSHKEHTDPQFHDASDPRCTEHPRALKAGHPARTERTCPKCLQERGFAALGVPLETRTRRRRRATADA